MEWNARRQVRNVSGLPIEWMNLHAPAADGSDDDGATNSGLVWDADVVAAHLPLAPGHSFVLPVRFRFGVHMYHPHIYLFIGIIIVRFIHSILIID
jgi:hypothetical protein